MNISQEAIIQHISSVKETQPTKKIIVLQHNLESLKEELFNNIPYQNQTTYRQLLITYESIIYLLKKTD